MVDHEERNNNSDESFTHYSQEDMKNTQEIPYSRRSDDCSPYQYKYIKADYK